MSDNLKLIEIQWTKYKMAKALYYKNIERRGDAQKYEHEKGYRLMVESLDALNKIGEELTEKQKRILELGKEYLT